MNISINTPLIPFDKPKKSTEKSDNEGNYKKSTFPLAILQAKPGEWQTVILGANIELHQFDFQVLLIILRNLKSNRRSRRNAVKTNALIILVQMRIRAIGLRTNPKRPNNSLSTRNVRIAVVRTIRQKTVGLALRIKGSPNPVKSLRTKRS